MVSAWFPILGNRDTGLEPKNKVPTDEAPAPTIVPIQTRSLEAPWIRFLAETGSKPRHLCSGCQIYMGVHWKKRGDLRFPRIVRLVSLLRVRWEISLLDRFKGLSVQQFVAKPTELVGRTGVPSQGRQVSHRHRSVYDPRGICTPQNG